MKAIVYHEHGESDVLRYEEIPSPVPGADEVLLSVGAVGVNAGPDIEARRLGFGMPGFELPHIGGVDPAGEILEVGSAVEGFAPGDRVAVYPVMPCGSCPACRSGRDENYCESFRLFGVQTQGGRADAVVAPASQLVSLPPAVSFDDAAALGVAYTTTWHGLVTRGGLTAEDTLLVMGAAGGCGVAAIQIGKLLGARVIAITGPSWKFPTLESVGADVVLSYRSDDWPAEVREATGGSGVSLAFDNAGADTLPSTVSCLAHSGRLVCSGGTSGLDVTLDLRVLYRNHLSLLFYVQGGKRDMEHLVDLVARGDLKPLIDERFPLAAAAQADDKLRTSRQIGRVILTNS